MPIQLPPGVDFYFGDQVWYGNNGDVVPDPLAALVALPADASQMAQDATLAMDAQTVDGDAATAPTVMGQGQFMEANCLAVSGVDSWIPNPGSQ